MVSISVNSNKQVSPVLVGMQLEGHIQDLVAEVNVTQTYVNTHDTTLGNSFVYLALTSPEIIFTFGTSPGVVLRHFASTVNGKRVIGKIMV